MELRDYLRGLRRHWLAIVLMVVVGLAVAFGWTKLQTPVYEATAEGLVQSVQTADEQTGLLPVYDTAAMQKLPTYLQMAGWEEVAQGAVEKAGLTLSAEQAAGLVTIENPESTAIITVTARGSTPDAAARLAEGWIASLTDTINRVEGGEAGVAPMTIHLASAAAVPSEPIFPDLRTALIVGGVLGLGVGIAFALIRTASDRRIRIADDVEARVGVAVMGTIPVAARDDDDAGRLLGSTGRHSNRAVSEALRTLRTNLRFVDVDNPPRKIVITSPLPGDGKSTIACNLAVTLAASGQPVILIDGDLRRPTVAATMGIVGGAGLTDVLSGRAELNDVLQLSPQASNLLVLGAGALPPNPSEILGSSRMRALLDELAEHATVIVDAPPLLPVTDSAVLTSQADGALLVVSIGKTTYDVVETAISTLHKAGGRLLGLVLNRIPLRGVDASPYSRAYGDSYAARDHDTPAPEIVDTPIDIPHATVPAAKPRRTGRTEPAESPFDAILADIEGVEKVEAKAPRRGRRSTA